MLRTNGLENVLTAARALLEARQNQMITRVEWESLASAVRDAAMVDAAVEEPLYSGWLAVWTDACREAAERALQQNGVIFRRRKASDRCPRYHVFAITETQYAAVTDALRATGEPGTDWSFPRN